MKWAVGVSIFVLRGMERVEWGFEALCVGVLWLGFVAFCWI